MDTLCVGHWYFQSGNTQQIHYTNTKTNTLISVVEWWTTRDARSVFQAPELFQFLRLYHNISVEHSNAAKKQLSPPSSQSSFSQHLQLQSTMPNLSFLTAVQELPAFPFSIFSCYCSLSAADPAIFALNSFFFLF